MKKGILCLGLIIPITLIILQGCGEPTIQEEKTIEQIQGTGQKGMTTTESKHELPKDVALVQELTLKLEDRITRTISSSTYLFNGFLGEDTLSFQYVDNGPYGDDSEMLYLPAKIGYKFKLKNFEDVKEVEILDFNSDQGYVKLKVSIKQLK